MAITDIDEQKLEAFVGHAATEVGAALNAALVTLGDELGLYRAMADGQPVTAAELAERTGTQERYVREWLNTQAASGFVELRRDGDATSSRPSTRSCSPTRRARSSMHGRVPGRERRGGDPRARWPSGSSTGDGVGWHEHHHDLWHGTERAFAAGYRDVPAWPSGCRRSTASSRSSRPARSSPTSAAATAPRRS